MSKLSAYIEAHVGFLNNFLPALKQVIDALPLPAAATTAFNDVYATAPTVITLGAAALSELHGGAPQPAAMDLASAFAAANAGKPAVTPPAPAPLVAPATPPSIITPPAPAPAATQPATTPPPSQPSTAPAPLVAMTPAASTADPFQGGQITGPELAKLAASLGLTLVSPAGPVAPGP